MGIQISTLKRLFAKSKDQCAMPRCTSKIIQDNIPVGEICHIKARNKKGPRYDAALTAKDKDSFGNLVLLCRTCHKLVDSDPKRYSVELLSEIKEIHEAGGDVEITPEIARKAELLMPRKNATAKAGDQGIAVAIAGDNNAPISVTKIIKEVKAKYPANAIGADANFAGYIDYLFGLGVEYWAGIESMSPGRLGRKIKTKFRLKASRTRNHLPVQRFSELVNFIIDEILRPSPAGKRNARNGTKLCRTFDEWTHGTM